MVYILEFILEVDMEQFLEFFEKYPYAKTVGLY